MPLAEETGLIVPIGARVLNEACRQLQEWRRAHTGLRDLIVWVNLSARQLAEPDLPDVVARALADSGLAPANLGLEITESAVMEDLDAAGRALVRLKTLGVGLALDDFGTGFSSMNYLKQFPVDLLKVDRSFVAGLGSNTGDSAIVAAVIGLAQSMGIATVAEGVETFEQLSALHTLGCSFAQGYFFGRPRSPAEAETSLTAIAELAASPFGKLDNGAHRLPCIVVDRIDAGLWGSTPQPPGCHGSVPTSGRGRNSSLQFACLGFSAARPATSTVPPRASAIPSARPRWSWHTTSGAARATTWNAQRCITSSTDEPPPARRALKPRRVISACSSSTGSTGWTGGLVARLPASSPTSRGLRPLETAWASMTASWLYAPSVSQALAASGDGAYCKAGRPAPERGAWSSTTRPASHSLARCWRTAVWFSPKCLASSATLTGSAAPATWRKMA